VKYIAVIVIAVAVVLGATLINMAVNHGCLPWEHAEQSGQGHGVEWECR
jgi:hypothetical protein